MKKYTATGAIIGIIVGITLQIFLPKILEYSLFYEIAQRKTTNIPLSPQFTSGSVFSVGFVFPILSGIAGALIGFVIYKLTKH